jgi:NTP pyrophosphatase (non-canonical NTP hydrolase)
MAAGEDMLEVARAYEELAEIAGELAEAVRAEDRASESSPRARARRSV